MLAFGFQGLAWACGRAVMALEAGIASGPWSGSFDFLAEHL